MFTVKGKVVFLVTGRESCLMLSTSFCKTESAKFPEVHLSLHHLSTHLDRRGISSYTCCSGASCSENTCLLAATWYVQIVFAFKPCAVFPGQLLNIECWKEFAAEK